MTDQYAQAGVDYDVLDAAKRIAIAAARATSDQLLAHGGAAADESRGEPAFLFSLGDVSLAFVLECLGTKSLLARQYQDETGADLFRNVGIDSVAAVVNDLCCVGALPLVVNAYFATGSPDWYADEGRFKSLTAGWADACVISGATWGGGESPSLAGLVSEHDVEIAGSAVGHVPAGVEPILGKDLAPGDEIVLIASTGLHANGASLVRKLGAELPDGLRTRLPSGKTFGEAALAASALYVPVVKTLLEERVPVTYLSHITGHGLRKVMRADRDLTYRITSLPAVPEVLSFMAAKLGMDDEDAYGTFNMGAGFAVYCRPGSGDDVVALTEECGHLAVVAGAVEEGERRVVLEPLGVEYSSAALSLR
ncbi:MAG TPA: AIR synthase-related protein [Actinomycetota bacterium]|nr:AIR synthase-related protein [Actinomycetota bacterium]